MLRDIQHKRSLSHRRSGRDQDQVRPLQARQLIIQIDKPGRDAGYGASCFGGPLNDLQGVENDLLDGHKVLEIAPLHQLKYPLLRHFQNFLQGTIFQVAGVGDLLIEFDQPAQGCLFLDDLRIGFCVCRGLEACQDILRELQAADLRRNILLFQVLLQCDQIHRLSHMK